MSKDDFYTPTYIDALRMENELLSFEVRFLKTQLAEVEQLRSRLAKVEREAEREAEQLRSRLAKAEREAAKAEREAEREAKRLRRRLARAKRAEQDIVFLLGRIANSPLGWFLRRKKGFRVLEQRYLDTDS